MKNINKLLKNLFIVLVLVLTNGCAKEYPKQYLYSVEDIDGNVVDLCNEYEEVNNDWIVTVTSIKGDILLTTYPKNLYKVRGFKEHDDE